MLFPFYLLVLEENPYEVALLRLLLKTHFPDWTCYIVTSRQELMQFLACGTPVSLLLMNVHLPHKEGITIVRDLRRRQVYRSLPIISFCSSVIPAYASDWIEAGASACFQKSPDIGQTISLIRNLPVFSTRHIN